MQEGLLGAILRILSTFAIAIWKEHIEAKACLEAITTEINCLFDLCVETFDEVITDDNKFILFDYPLGTDYFSIFNANTSKIGRIGNKLERKLIVAIYIAAKYFLDCIKTNNNCLDYCSNIDEKYVDKTSQEYMLDVEFAQKNLLHSKVNNLLPAYKKLKELMGLYKELQKIKPLWLYFFKHPIAMIKLQKDINNY